MLCTTLWCIMTRESVQAESAEIRFILSIQILRSYQSAKVLDETIAELLVSKVLLECKDLLVQQVCKVTVHPKNTMVLKVFLENKAITVNEVNMVNEVKKTFKVIWWKNVFRQVSCIRGYLSIIEASGGVQMLCNVSAYHEPAWHLSID